jgi:geranylgeranyl pyrophosphate synthase
MLESPLAATAQGDVFRAFVSTWRPAVEAALDDLLPAGDSAKAEDLPGLDRLHVAMRYSVFAGGKRLRPMLALIAARASGGDPERALRAAAGLELLHTYSLVHDDLPCMDDDDLRRGRPTCHKKFGDAVAVLVGDALLTLAFEAVADGGGDPARGAQAVLALARGAGSGGMVGGQALDLAAEHAVERVGASDAAIGEPMPGVSFGSLEHVQAIHDRKTAALIRASLEVGVLAGGGRLEVLPDIRRFGDLVGRGFQVADDILDVTGTAEDLGKQPGQDEAAGKLTYPAVLGLDEARRIARELADEASALASKIVGIGRGGREEDISLLRDVALYSVARSN